MTAPDLVEVVAEALADFRGRKDGATPYEIDQARAVLDALAGAGTVEWGVAWKGAGPDGVLVFDSEEDAREAVELGGLLSRLTLPWTAAAE